MSGNKASFARRSFIKDSGLMIAGGAIGGAIAVGKAVKGGDDAPIKVAFVGCGRRARELADAAMSVPNESVSVVGLADFFGCQTQSMYRSLKGRYGDRVASACIRANGNDCLGPILESDADLVYVTTPPVCRPEYFGKLVDAKKHVFLEKPLAADPQGVEDMVATADRARESGLSVHVGFQRRFNRRYQDVIAKVREGAIGTPLFARAYCNAGPLRRSKPVAGENPIELQMRNWNHFQWTGGDFLLEQHVAGLDVIRWALDEMPLVAQGQGGWNSVSRVAGSEEALDSQAEVFDHHSVEYEFASGVHLLSQCRRAEKSWNQTSEHVHGDEGRADLTAGRIYDREGKLVWRSEHSGSLKNATRSQQQALFGSIRKREPESQVHSAAESTLFAMLGHQASRSGKRTRLDGLTKGRVS